MTAASHLDNDPPRVSENETIETDTSADETKETETSESPDNESRPESNHHTANNTIQSQTKENDNDDDTNDNSHQTRTPKEATVFESDRTYASTVESLELHASSTISPTPNRMQRDRRSHDRNRPSRFRRYSRNSGWCFVDIAECCWSCCCCCCCCCCFRCC